MAIFEVAWDGGKYESHQGSCHSRAKDWESSCLMLEFDCVVL